MNTLWPQGSCRVLSAGLLLGLLLSGCGLLGDDNNSGVSAVAVPPSLVVITNHTSETAYTFVVGRKTAATINWHPSVDGEGLAPGNRERVRYADIFRTQEEEEAIVYWWQAVEKNGERVHGEIYSIVVNL